MSSFLEQLQEIPDLIGLIFSFVPNAQLYRGTCKFLNFHILKSFHPTFLYKFHIPANPNQLSYLNLDKYAYFQPSYSMIKKIFSTQKNLEASIEGLKYVSFILKSKLLLANRQAECCFITLCCEHWIEERLEIENLAQFFPCLLGKTFEICKCKKHREFVTPFCTFIQNVLRANLLSEVNSDFLQSFCIRYALDVWQEENPTFASERRIQIVLDFWDVLCNLLLSTQGQDLNHPFMMFAQRTDYTNDIITLRQLIFRTRIYFSFQSFELVREIRDLNGEIRCLRALLFELGIACFLDHANFKNEEIFKFLSFFYRQARVLCSCPFHCQYSGVVIAEILAKAGVGTSVEFANLLYEHSAKHSARARAYLVTSLLKRKVDENSIQDAIDTSESICKCFDYQRGENPMEIFTSLPTATLIRLKSFTLRWKDHNQNLCHLLETCYPIYSRFRKFIFIYLIFRVAFQGGALMQMSDQSFFLLMSTSMLFLEIGLCFHIVIE